MDNADRIEAVRRFNRFYTRHLGVLNEGLLDSPFSLTEARVLWELSRLDEGSGITATELGQTLDLNAGYLSRLLKALKERELIESSRSAADGRQWLLQLSPAGRAAFAPLDQRSQQQTDALLTRLSDTQQVALLQAFRQVQALLEDPKAKPARGSFILRPPRPGDMGWVVSRHGALYAREYQFDMSFEALVARIAADFLDRFDPHREACWMAERDGVNLGCVCLVQARDEASAQPIEGTAQLRLLLVEPTARGLGLGERLVAECTRFAVEAGYRRIRLWTHSQLGAARHLYAKAGYRLMTSEPFTGFGHEQVAETWELDLAAHP
ncbi:bifunctional helix-turn-helix transcriptional regulator/GNAT family N-acetyltransferase [Ideonella oryzae]|uniref:Bifunctional helix-turn-helix transcriptional regulator/GNAT family N-acetyltransferase n=1 Tax=Ideonella oryzae TaxID=2937441 RepID=A0ABT1BIM9_9BURK|nr:bifunctional helix-turn-helix transcriptional regulator/GNAT family N-acetyltransferase [Ideonella oryzae]MCO5975282.1 bifunctional helix-turn-helix transcriptional regulator/GNAT family N-acetyltransferase [Ideonella oryzae]